ncbi:MAG: hypothetical protein ABI791_08900 [Acidobacteriota bacterium]
MIKYLFVLALAAAASVPISAQKIIRETPTPTPVPSIPKAAPPIAPQAPAEVPVKTATANNEGSGNVYRNSDYGFQITFPADWRITSDDFGEYARSQGFDLSLKAPDALTDVNKVRINRALKNVTVLLTAFRSVEGVKDAAILRISVEDLTIVPQVRDGVDYFDLMRSQFSTLNLPADFRYSETQAEKLGRKQFAFIDTSTSAGKKRLYATVRGRKAIMFTLSYRTDADLQSMRQILAAGDFNNK